MVLGFNVFPPLLLFVAILAVLFSPSFLLSFPSSVRGSVRTMGARRWQLPESPSTGLEDSLPSFIPGESLRPVEYRENVSPSTLYQSMRPGDGSLLRAVGILAVANVGLIPIQDCPLFHTTEYPAAPSSSRDPP